MPEGKTLAALAPVLLLVAGFVWYCLRDIARAPRTARAPKWVWVLACLASVPAGGIAYLLLGREDR